MKKLLAILLAMLLVISMAACAQTVQPSEEKTADSQTENNAQMAQTPAAEEQPSEAGEDADASAPQEAHASDTAKASLAGKKIALLVKSQTNIFWVQICNRAQELSDELGFELQILAPTTANSNEEQIQLLENSLIDPPDLYIIAPADSAGIIPAIEEINEAGVPIVNLNTKISSDSVELFSFVSCEQYGLGKLAIQEAIDRLSDSGSCIFIKGPLGAQTHVDRIEGAKAVLAENPGWTLLDEQIGNANRADALSITQTLLSKYDKIDFIFAGDAEMGLGAAEAIAQAGRADEIKVVCINCNEEVCQAIRDGRIWVSIDDSPASQVDGAVSVAAMYFNGEAVGATYYTDIHAVDLENVETQEKLYIQ